MEDKDIYSLEGREWGIVGGPPEYYEDPAERTIIIVFCSLLLAGIVLAFLLWMLWEKYRACGGSGSLWDGIKWWFDNYVFGGAI
jgi:hypothetical protein